MTTFQQLGNLSLEYARVSEQAYKEFAHRYETMNPRIKLPAPAKEDFIPFWHRRNASMLGMIPKAFFTVVISTIRTGTEFFKIAKLGEIPDFLQGIYGWSSIFAFEVGLMIYAYYRAERQARDGHDSDPSKKIGLSVVIMLLVMLSTALAVTLPILESVDTTAMQVYVDWFLFICVVVGVVAMTFLDGDILGELFTKWSLRNEGIEERYVQALKRHQLEQRELDSDYNKALRSEWEESEIYKNLQRQFKSVALNTRKNTIPVQTQPVDAFERVRVAPATEPLHPNGAGELSKGQRAAQIVKRVFDMSGTLPGDYKALQALVADAGLVISDGLASELNSALDYLYRGKQDGEPSVRVRRAMEAFYVAE